MYVNILKQFSQNIRYGQFDEILELFTETQDSVEKLLIIDGLEANGGFQRPQVRPRIAKNNERSALYRNLGNGEFNKRNRTGYLAALKQYNKSICHAENGSEELALGYSNRSAVYFELGLYDDCIENIQLARQTAPNRILAKLNNREGDCFRRKGVATNNPLPRFSPKVTLPVNAQIPFIANCLKLERNEQYGRHIITTTDLKSGDVVAVEDAFCSVLDHKYRYVRCEKCLNENNYNLIPCRDCVSVMFCAKCRDEASEKFHNLECPVIDLMAQLLCEKTLLTLRKFICTITSFRSAAALIAFIEEAEGQDWTIFDCDYTRKSSHYAPVHFTAENLYNDVGAELSRHILVSLIFKPLMEQTQLKDNFTDDQAVKLLRPLLLHQMKRNQVERAGSVCFNEIFFEYARGVHPFRDLLNHSCAPNLYISSVNTKFVYTVLKPIKAGEQLFDNYGVTFRHETLEQRQEALKYFRCQCKACFGDYRLESEMGRGKPIPDLQVLHPISMTSLKLCSDYLNKYHRYFPCKQLLFAEDEFGSQLERIYDTEEPMERRFK